MGYASLLRQRLHFRHGHASPGAAAVASGNSAFDCHIANPIPDHPLCASWMMRKSFHFCQYCIE